MSQMLAEVPSSTEIIPLQPAVLSAILSFSNAVEISNLKPRLRSDLAPSPKWRAFLMRRESELARWLLPATSPAVGREIKRLFDFLANRDSDVEGEKEKIATYVAILRDLPLPPIQAATVAYLSGAIGDGRWMPKPGELRKAVERLMLPYAMEHKRIATVLAAEVYEPPTAAERARALERAKVIIDEIVQTSLADPVGKIAAREVGIAPSKESRASALAGAQAALDRLAENPLPPVSLSPEALQLFHNSQTWPQPQPAVKSSCDSS